MTSKSILQMSSEEAKEFLLKSSSYVSFDLPTYITFDYILNEAKGYFQNEDSNVESYNRKKCS